MNESSEMAKDRWIAIVNPNAGVRKAGQEWPAVSDLLSNAGVDFRSAFTEFPGHADQLVAEAIKEGFRNVIVAGGDGTLNEVANGIFKQPYCEPSEITVGMIPIGSGNDWCRTLGIPIQFRESVEIIREKRTLLQDVGKVQYSYDEQSCIRYFLNVAGLGYDALVAHKTNLQKLKGMGGPLSYLYFVFASLLQFRFPDAVVTIDGCEVFRGDLFSMNVGICKYSGNGMMQVPYAIPDDGLLDVTLIRKTSKLTAIRYATKLYDGTLVNLPIVSTYRGKIVTVESSKQIFMEVDGESVGYTPFTFGILPQALRVVCGKYKRW